MSGSAAHERSRRNPKPPLVVEGTPFKAVSGAAGFAAAREIGVKTNPVAFVYFGDEVSGENIGGTGPVMQLQERDLSVVYGLWRSQHRGRRIDG